MASFGDDRSAFRRASSDVTATPVAVSASAGTSNHSWVRTRKQIDELKERLYQSCSMHERGFLRFDICELEEKLASMTKPLSFDDEEKEAMPTYHLPETHEALVKAKALAEAKAEALAKVETSWSKYEELRGMIEAGNFDGTVELQEEIRNFTFPQRSEIWQHLKKSCVEDTVHHRTWLDALGLMKSMQPTEGKTDLSKIPIPLHDYFEDVVYKFVLRELGRCEYHSFKKLFTGLSIVHQALSPDGTPHCLLRSLLNLSFTETELKSFLYIFGLISHSDQRVKLRTMLSGFECDTPESIQPYWQLEIFLGWLWGHQGGEEPVPKMGWKELQDKMIDELKFDSFCLPQYTVTTKDLKEMLIGLNRLVFLVETIEDHLLKNRGIDDASQRAMEESWCRFCKIHYHALKKYEKLDEVHRLQYEPKQGEYADYEDYDDEDYDDEDYPTEAEIDALVGLEGDWEEHQDKEQRCFEDRVEDEKLAEMRSSRSSRET